MDNDYEKYENLANYLIKVTAERPQKIIIFCHTKKGVDYLERAMKNDYGLNKGVKLEAKGIHGDKLQYERDNIFARFKLPMN